MCHLVSEGMLRSRRLTAGRSGATLDAVGSVEECVVRESSLWLQELI